MRADHGDWVSGLPFLADCEGNDGRSVAGKVVLPSGDEARRPAVAFFDLYETGFGEALDGGMNGVVSCAVCQQIGIE